MPSSDYRFCIAPMMRCTNRHGRYMLRLLSRRMRLYSEMITANALIYGDAARHLDFDAAEHPLGLQLGGSDPRAMAQAAKMGEDWGYDEININAGCPSNRVQNGEFGACLFCKPELLAECVDSMRAQVRIPVSIKTRIGVDDTDRYEDLVRLVELTSQAGCKVFFIHARKAWLQGLSPAQNRNIPELDYQRVQQLKRDFPDLCVVLNGGLESHQQCDEALGNLDGVMLGRTPFANPWMLQSVDPLYFNQSAPVQNRWQVATAMLAYAEQQLQQGEPLARIVHPMLGLWHGEPGGRRFRRALSERKPSVSAPLQTLHNALQEPAQYQMTVNQ